MSRRFGELKNALERQGERIDDFDVAIAAHAVALKATVVTRNLRHFAAFPGVPWKTGHELSRETLRSTAMNAPASRTVVSPAAFLIRAATADGTLIVIRSIDITFA